MTNVTNVANVTKAAQLTHIANAQLLAELHAFVDDEQLANSQKLIEVWDRPLAEKLSQGWSQGFTRLVQGEAPATIWAYLDASESRFREGDLLFLHGGSPHSSPIGRRLSLESEEDGRWLLSTNNVALLLSAYAGGPCYADPDSIDLTPYYKRVLAEIAASQIGLEVVLPLLTGELAITFDDRDVIEGERMAREAKLNVKQAEAVGLAFGAEQIACIQGPPGTGKTRVLALIVQLMVNRGERILITSHTHMAINNALNKIHATGVPIVKVGRLTQRKGLDETVPCVEEFSAWKERPTGAASGYAVGATPFATVNARLENVEFDAIIFDEASQITVPLALMAMRKGKRFIFIGDQKQLPPIMLSRSVLDKNSLSVFAKLTAQDADHTIMLNDTYRMNRWLTNWPSRTYYGGKLIAAGVNCERQLTLSNIPARLLPIFEPSASAVFVPTLDRAARTKNFRDAELVAEICEAAVAAGMAIQHIGIVTPYRSQGRTIRNLLVKRFGRQLAQQLVADTVERMQGQEREVIILSLATGDEVFLSAVAGFFFQPERLNVSITRAMTKLIVIGPDVGPDIGPDIGATPEVENDMVKNWVAQYRDFVGQLKRVDL